jgi:hypothetical protein
MQNKKKSDISTNLLVIIGYTVLTLIMTYPIIFRLSDSIIGGGGDTYWCINIMWWFKKSLLDPNLSFYNTTYLYYPTGASLAFSDVAPFLMIISLPLQILFGRIITYNILILSSFILSSFGAYLLVEYLTNDKKASFVAGIIFSFCPQHLMQVLGHLNIVSIQFIPFFILYFLKTVKDGKKKDAVLAAIFLSIASLCTWYNAIYLLLFVGFYVVFSLFEDKEKILDRKVIENLTLVGILSFLLVLPFAYPMFSEMGKSAYMVPSPNESVFYSADLVGFFIPSVLHPLFGQYVSQFYQQFTGNGIEDTTYIGYTVIFLVAYYILKCRKKLGEASFWIWLATFFFILSLGPILHIMGRTHFTVFDVTVPLPYLILYYIPAIQIARVPSRLVVMLMLSLAVLAGYGLKELLKHINGKLLSRISKKDIIVLILSFLVIFEFMVIPYQTAKVTVPEFYKQFASDKEDNAIMEVPFKQDVYVFSVSDYMYYQTIHEKRLVGGYLSRTPKYASDFVENTPIVSDYWNLHPTSDILNQDLAKIGSSLLDYYNIRYVIIHKQELNQTELAYIENLSKNIFNDSPFYDDGEIEAYKVKKIQNHVVYMVCGSNFYAAENWGGGNIWRWMDNDAELIVVNTNEEDISTNLSFSVISFAKLRNLEVRVNNVTVQNMSVAPGWSEENVVIPDITLHTNKNIIEFHTLEEPVIIDNVLHNGDTRRVGLALSNVSLEVR